MMSQDSMYRQVLQSRRDLYNTALDNGVHTPFLVFQDSLPVACLAAGVILTPYLPRAAGRITRCLLTLASAGYMVLRWPYTRTIGLAVGYGIGLSGFWVLIMTVNLLLLHDPGRDFRRIEVRKPMSRRPTSPGAGSVANGTSAISEKPFTRSRFGQSSEEHPSRPILPESEPTFVWQGRPTGILHLVDWSVDLMTSFRGVNWNFRIPIKTYQVPPPQGNPPQLSPEAKKLNEDALPRLQRSAILNFIYYYLVIDLLKTCLMTDPYWLGIAPLDSPSPWAWVEDISAVIPGFTKFVRLSISLASVVSALTIIFSLNPLFFATFLPCFLRDKLYTVTKCPLSEVWLYPAQWGNMFQTLCNKGLAGMWSTWWHQMFRYGISEPSRLLVKRVNINPRSQLARLIQLFIAFGLTGGIHAAASSTTFSIVPAEPWHPFIFFVSQAVGIIFQTEASRRLNSMVSFPKRLRQAANFGFVFVFLWHTGPYLSDDFARCGIWLFEPVPISIFRGLGFGPGDCWAPWFQYPEGHKWLGWWNGVHWYKSGIAIY